MIAWTVIFVVINRTTIASDKLDDRSIKNITRTIQPVNRTAAQRTEKTGKTEAEENICEIRSVCDSLNKLHVLLSRLNYVLQKKVSPKKARRH